MSFPCSSASKESACNVRNLGSTHELGRSPGEGKGYPLQYSGEFHGLYSPLGCRKLDMTKQLSLHFIHHIIHLPFNSFSCSVMSNSLQPHGLQHARLPVHHQRLELDQTHVHCVSDAIQPSHPLTSPSPAFNLSQHQGLF